MEDSVSKEKSKIVSGNFIAIGLVSAGFGAFHGFHDGMEIPLPNKSLDAYLVFSPSIIQGLMGILDGISLSKRGRQITGNYPIFMEEVVREDISRQKNEKFIKNEFYGSIMGCVGETVQATLENLLGYAAGYLIGKIVRAFS